MTIAKHRPYLQDINNLYRVAGAVVGTIIIYTGWKDSASQPILMLFFSYVFIYVGLDYIIERAGSKSTRLRLIRMHSDDLMTGLLLVLAQFNYIIFISIVFSSFVNQLLYKPGKSFLIMLILMITGTVLGSWLLPELNSPSITAIALTAVISSSYGGLVVYFLLLKQQRIKKRLSLTTATNKMLTDQVFKLSEYLSPTVRRAILSGVSIRQEPGEKQVTVFFSDIVGFTSLSENLSPDNLSTFLNTYLEEMSKIAVRFGGTIDKIMGDSIMVFFGDPRSRGVTNDAFSCVSMALAMKKKMANLQLRWQKEGIETPPTIRIGINSGLCKVGNFGSTYYLNYTLLGRSVNLASRLETAASAGEILISISTYNIVKNKIHCINKGEVSVDGFIQPLLAYSVVGFREQDKKTLSDQPKPQA